MDKNKKVSIILPTFNGARYISRSIESVLTQSFSDWELLIIDDGSKDNTENIVKEYANKDSRIIYFKNEINLGIRKSLNIGLKEAKGKYIARIDDDDEWIDAKKLQKQIEFLQKTQDCALVGTGVVIINEKRKELTRYLLPENNEDIRSKMLIKNCFIHSSVVFIKEIAISVGGYSEEPEVKNIEDYDLWLKIGEISKVYNLAFYGVNLMIRKDSKSSKNKIEQIKRNIRLIKKYKNKYPNYFKSIIARYTILLFYKIFNLFFSVSFKNKLIKLYKKA